jgi:membrane protease YdiL (CAAX protease family)
MIVARAVAIGILVLLAGTIPRNLLFAANLRYYPDLPWSVPLMGVYLWIFWRMLLDVGLGESSADERRAGLRAHPIPASAWTWSLLAGGFGIVALVLALRVANRLVILPPQELPDLSHVPALTIVSMLIIAAPIAGVVEEAAFRGYMQGPIEHRYGLVVAILITGTMFAVAHLDFTFVLWPYYLAVAAIYGTVTSMTGSIFPAIVLHTAGNLYSNFDLWLHGQAEWQAASGPGQLIWHTGTDAAFWWLVLALGIVVGAMLWAFTKLEHLPKLVERADVGDLPAEERPR